MTAGSSRGLHPVDLELYASGAEANGPYPEGRGRTLRARATRVERATRRGGSRRVGGSSRRDCRARRARRQADGERAHGRRQACAAATGAESLATGDWVLLADGDEAARRRRGAAAPFGVRARRPDGRDRAQRAGGRGQHRHRVRRRSRSTNGPNLRRLERELVLAFESGAAPVIVLDEGGPRRRSRAAISTPTSPRSSAPASARP